MYEAKEFRKTGEDGRVASIDIGEKLREARLQKNMTLDELQQITKVQKRYLSAIENNDYDSMPGTFYVRTFIRQYASAVGLDGNELVDIFDGKDIPEDIEDVIDFEALEESRLQLLHEEEESRFSEIFKSLPAIVFSLVGLAIAVVVLYFMWQDKSAEPIIQTPTTISIESSSSSVTQSTSSETETTQSSTTESSSEEKPAMTIQNTGEVNNVVNMSIANAQEPLTLEFTGKNGSGWVGVIINGNYTYQYTLPVGEKQTTEIPAGTTLVTVSLGAAANTDITLNGQKVEYSSSNEFVSKEVILNIAYLQ